MTNKQALAYAKHELEYYKQVEREGIRTSQHIEFYERVVEALEKQEPEPVEITSILTVTGELVHNVCACPVCKHDVNELADHYCHQCGQALK